MTVEQKHALAAGVAIDQEVLHGTPSFSKTRVPVATLTDFWETGDSIDDFLESYSYMPREQVLSFLELSLSNGFKV